MDEPVVWTSADGGTWTKTWDAGRVAHGYESAQQLVATSTELVLSDGNSLWRSADAAHWQQLPLPSAVQSYPLRSVTSGHGLIVAVFSQPATGAPGEFSQDSVWTSRDGVGWQRVSLGSPALVEAVSTTPTGFILGGQSGASVVTLHPTVWVSNDGAEWTSVVLGGYPGSVSAVAGDGTTMVASGVVNGDYLDWWSDDGLDWSMTQSPLAPGIDSIVATGGGFIEHAYGTSLWWSKTGSTWSPVTNAGAPGPPPPGVSYQTLLPDQQGADVLVSEPSRATAATASEETWTVQLWHIGFTSPARPSSAPPSSSNHDIRLRYEVTN